VGLPRAQPARRARRQQGADDASRAHEALLDVVDRDGDQDDEDWGEAAQDADPMDLALVPSARLALRRLAANADSRVDDSWPVVVDRLRLIRIELLDLSAWAESATTRTAVAITASRSLRRFQGAGRTALFAHIAVLAFGTELVPLDGWKTAGGGGRGLALRRLLPLAEEQLRALAVCHQQQQQQQQSCNKRERTDDNETAVDG
jgi:hypothetical protein